MSYTDKYAERNAGLSLNQLFANWMSPDAGALDIVQRKQEAADATDSTMIPTATKNLHEGLSAVLDKPDSENRAKAEDLHACMPMRITHITRCEGGTCTRVKVCE